MAIMEAYPRHRVVDLARIPQDSTRVREEEMVGLDGLWRARGKKMIGMFEAQRIGGWI